jgi:hypothetical protein
MFCINDMLGSPQTHEDIMVVTNSKHISYFYSEDITCNLLRKSYKIYLVLINENIGKCRHCFMFPGSRLKCVIF